MLQAMAFFLCYHCSACFAAYKTTASVKATFSPPRSRVITEQRRQPTQSAWPLKIYFLEPLVRQASYALRPFFSGRRVRDI